jgi:hypothetical protein
MWDGLQPVMPFLKRAGFGLPVSRRRTFAAGILPFAHSDAAYASPSWLRLAAYAGSGIRGPRSLLNWRG